VGETAKKGSRVVIVISTGPAIKGMIDVANESPAEASANLRKAGFKARTKPQSSSTVPAGTVIGTEPSTGTATVQGTTVAVLVSSGPAPVSVPSLRGDTLATAEAALTSNGLTLGEVTNKPSPTATPGTVLSQSPAAGLSVRAGSKVGLTVAEAPKVTVPTVVGDTEVVAKAMLERLGLVPQVSPEVTTEASKQGLVTRQNPTGGTRALKGATVIIFVGETGTTSTPTTSTSTSPPPSSSSSGSSQP
jgi:serine/threonine-protein kinase